MPRDIIRFAAVGFLAMVIHLLTVAMLVPLGLEVLVANCAGFLLAFQVSYVGHSSWTFRGHRQSGSYFRLFVVSASGFAANEICYACLLELHFLHYLAALSIVLIGIAAATYLLSKFWVFHHPQKAP
jgi:putative flippase GtrA